MPNLKIRICLRKGEKGARGTEKAQEMCDVLSNHWSDFRECFEQMSEDDQNDMISHFESLDENYGDILFGDDSSAEDMTRYVLSRNDESQQKFVSAMDEALDQVLYEGDEEEENEEESKQ